VSEQRGDPAARAIAHDADAPPEAGRDPHAPVAHPQAGPPPTEPADDSPGHAVDDHDRQDSHEAQPLGPIDTVAWAAGVVGVALGLAVAFAFVAASAGIG